MKVQTLNQEKSPRSVHIQQWIGRWKMKYGKVLTGTFMERPNKFIAYCEIDGKREEMPREEHRAMQGTVVSAYFEH